MNRTASTGRSRRSSMNRSTTSIGRSTSDVAGGVQKKSHISKSGPLIMFSNSSGLLRPPPIEQKLECSLEDLFHGCVKHIKVSRNLYTLTGYVFLTFMLFYVHKYNQNITCIEDKYLSEK